MKIKGFDKNLCCRGMQYEIGKEYSTNARNITSDDLCSAKVFHYCDSLLNVHEYYPCNKYMNNRFCEIEVLGEEVTDGKKYGSNHIKIVREITGKELNVLKGLINGNTGLFNSGYRNSGDRNSGDRNSGYLNSGDWNSGNLNSGDGNSGDRNSGDRNSGDWNSCNYSCGIFCNKDDDNIRIFNIPSGMSYKEFVNSIYYDAINSSPFILTEWIEYTDDEKKADIRKALDEGYLKVYGYKEACKNWWDNMSESNRHIIKTLPNFDAEIFEDITGIKI